MKGYFCLMVLLFLAEGKGIFGEEYEPRCYSRFDWEDKLLEKTIRTDIKVDQYMEKLERAKQEIEGHQENFQQMKESIATESENLINKVQKTLDELREWKKLEDAKSAQFKDSIRLSLGTTYTRWGRTICPGNGSESLYDGYAGGSLYSHGGGASSMLCLPKDPDWDSGKYNDQTDSDVGYVYGAEYEDGSSRSDQLFGESHYQRDVPCVVCDVRRRSSAIMIPGKSRCYRGWTFEYSGYLMSGYYGHSATDYHCVDKNPENLLGGEANNNGYLLYFVESRCGSLRCPPYVDGRELQCVVCTK